MIKNISLSRKEYRKAYALLRYTGGHPDFLPLSRMDDVTVDCATLSFDERDNVFSGWINRQRQHQFFILRNVKVLRTVFPF